MKKNIALVGIALLSLGVTSCKKKGCTDEAASNYDADAKKDDQSCLYDTVTPPPPGPVAPSTYAFTDANGNSTVSYSGQQIRLEYLTEMTSYMKTSNTSGTSVDATTLKNMFAHNGYTWTDAPGLNMNDAGNTKQLKNKTAGGDAIITALYEGYMDSIANASLSVTAGSAGVAGVVTSTTNPSKAYLQDAKGVEWTQLIEKGLMGACFYYNISSVYLAAGKMNVDNSTAVDAADGKYYTAMEHHWDEAYGYFTSEIDYPTNGTNRFWGKYANSRESVLESATKIGDAFRLGRAAISMNDLTVRDAQIAIINTELEKMIAGTAIHYLNGAVNDVADDALRNHQISEAVAFIQGLAYGANPTISNTQIAAVLATIGDDYYNVTVADLNSARDQLSTIFSMDDIKTAL